ncbi:RNA polymerase sigma-70 factor [Pedobacter sp. MC2016-05]|uniref:RNA polymerase sigma factor n=1 Tax=Pedobacter sp. MC2016-05 TaxID=2994474 RepID=UPI002248206A|nr:RNA polymerase sigma-70 factor [Pedobacter sp. MC2016-05]MCX2475324.1 RNA polymerase sigma-70 factor [Pedobacter sp. MC2016-05]
MQNLNILADNELVDLIRSGDQKAFTEVYNRYWRVIYAHVFKMLRDEEEAKDIIQELFSNIWLKADKIPQHQNFAGYLYTSARYKVLNAIRHNKHKDVYLNELIKFSSDVSEDTLMYLDEKDLLMAIEREIKALPPRMRQVFEMSRKENLTYKQIAERLGTSDQTVKKQISKSLSFIRNNLKESGGSAILLLIFTR